MEKKNSTFTYRSSALCVLILGILSLLGGPSAPDGKNTETIAHDTHVGRDIVGYSYFGEGDNAIVQYQYRADLLPEKLSPHEDVSLRTPMSYTELINTDGVTDTYRVTAYAEPTFDQDTSGAWRYIEHATTTALAFNSLRRQNPVASLFWKEAYADSISPFAGAGDGYVENLSSAGNCNTNWATPHAAAAGTTAYPTDTTTKVNSYSVDVNAISFHLCGMTRAFLPFDTSSIPSGAVVSATTLNIYVSSTQDHDNDGEDFLTVVQTSQATHTTLATADYDMCGAISNPTEGIDTGSRKDITSISTSAYLTFTLNSTGLGWVTKSGQASTCTATSGITCIGLREGHDALNSALPGGIDQVFTNEVVFSSSEASGTSQDPYLTVTYSVSTTRVLRLFGNIRLRGVRLSQY